MRRTVAGVPTLEHWRRVHLGTPRPATPRWAAPAAAAGIVLTAVGLWAQLPRPTPSATSAALEPVASTASTRHAAPSMTPSRPGGVIETAGARWQIGSPDDQVLQGDWDCDGRATLALLRPTTGDIYRFDAWSAPDADVRGTPVARVPGARSLRSGDLDGDRCDDLLVEAADGTTTAIGLR